ncbi:MAG: hypothetical protein HOY79_55255 [Streptomyces sp.]|nr:hypothetical protein [Streptomyces sp.]
MFAPDAPGRSGPRIRNEQLVRHAGDPRNAGITALALRLGGPGTAFDVLPQIAGRLGLDTRTDHTLWKDRAPTRVGVTVTDHPTESRRHPDHLGREERKAAGWAPTGGSCRTYDTAEHGSAYVHHPEALAPALGTTGASVAAWSNTPRMV